MLISEQARLAVYGDNKERNTETVDNVNIVMDSSEIEDTNNKSWFENYLFTIQMSIRKLLKQVAKFSGLRGRAEDELVITKQSLGQIVKNLINEICKEQQLSKGDPEIYYKLYYFTLVTSDAYKLLISEANSGFCIISFVGQGGVLCL